MRGNTLGRHVMGEKQARPLTLGLFVVFVLSSFAPTASAQGVEAAADVLINSGYERLAEGDAEVALSLFQQAHQIYPSPRSLAQIGLAEGALERWGDAEGHLAEAISNAAHPWIAPRIEPLRARLEAVREHLGRLEVTGGDPRTTLRVDGRNRGPVAAESLWLAPGEHRIEVRGAGLTLFTRTVTLREGETTRLQLDPRAEQRRTTRGPVQRAEPEPPAEPTRMWTPGWFVAGGGVAFAAAGAALAAVAATEHTTLLDLCSNDGDGDDMACTEVSPTEIERRASAGEAMAISGDLLLYSGVALAVSGLVLALAGPSMGLSDETQERLLSLRVGASPIGGTLILEGSW